MQLLTKIKENFKAHRSRWAGYISLYYRNIIIWCPPPKEKGVFTSKFNKFQTSWTKNQIVFLTKYHLTWHIEMINILRIQLFQLQEPWKTFERHMSLKKKDKWKERKVIYFFSKQIFYEQTSFFFKCGG